MCVKLADLTTHSPAEDLRSPPHSDTPSPSTSDRPRNADARPQAVRCTPRRPHNPFPPKTFAHPRTATRPSRALPIAPSVLTHAHAAPTHARRLRDARPADLTTLSPPKTFARPRTATRPSRTLPLLPAAPTLAHAVPTHARRLCDAFPAALTSLSPPKTFARPRSPDACPQCAMHSPPTSQPIPRRRPSLPHAAPTHARRLRDARPPTAQPIPRTASRCLPFRSASGTKKRHRTVHVRCRMSRSTVVAVGHLGW